MPDDSAVSIVEAWESSHRDLLALGRGLDDSQWRTPTACPGWTVGDVVAHNAWIEGRLVGQEDPPHEVDWTRLPHARSDFGRACEVPVDLRRAWTQQEVLDELERNIDDHLAALRAGPQDLDAELIGPWGTPQPIRRTLEMRTFDAWVHEFDIRTALGAPGHLDSPGARVTAQRLSEALPFVVGKKAGAPAGASVRIQVTGPGIETDLAIVVGNDGRARVGALADDPTTQIALSWPDFVTLACGRAPIDAVANRVETSGDRDLAQRILGALAITP